ncbi:MAG: CRISPR-associated endonuclease Cas1 [Candidatus Thorarchaeota archaeon]
MSLVIDTHGTFLGKRGKSLYVRKPDGVTSRRSLYNLTDVIVLCNCSMSSQVIELLSNNSIPIVMIKSGKPYAIIHPFFNHGTVHTRREQLSAFWDVRGAQLARAFVLGAMRNKQKLLTYWSRNRRKANPDVSEELSKHASKIEKLEIDIPAPNTTANLVRQDYMSTEAWAAKEYFAGMKRIVPENFAFRGRERRPSRDPINSMLSYGYAILYSRVLTALAACGLEPFAGYLHADRSGKPSLVLDMVEEFRQVAVDKEVIKLVMQGRITIEGFKHEGESIKMSEETRRILIANILDGFSSELRIGKDKKMTLSRLLMRQSRRLARFLIGKEGSYKPYIFRW